MTVFAHSQTTHKLVAGKIVKYRPLSEPIRLQDLEDSARSQAWKKIDIYIFMHEFFLFC